jgi:hypothetical protein
MRRSNRAGSSARAKRPKNRLNALVLLVVALICLGGCGRGGGDAVVAQVGANKITESTLHHWVATFIRGDFYQVIGAKAPAGLATDPPDYASCVSAAKTLVPRPGSGKPRLNTRQLETRCHELYEAVKLEALSYLISALWTKEQAAQLGHPVTDSEVHTRLQGLIAEKYKTQQAFQSYLRNKGWSLADMNYILKRNLGSERVLEAIRRQAASGGTRAFARVVLRNNAKWTAKTNCRAGYLVWQCQEYKPTSPTTRSPAVLFEEMGVR